MTGPANTGATACETGVVHDADRTEPSGGQWAPPMDGTPAGTPASNDPGMSTESTESFGQRVAEGMQRLGLGDVDVPFDSVADAVRWWFRPLSDPRVWRSFASILAAGLISGLLFGLAVAIIVVTSVASLIAIGLVLVPPAFAAIAAFAAVGRRLAGWGVEEPIPARPFAPRRSGLLGPVTSRLSDETRWRHVGFVMIDVVVAPLFLAGALLPITVFLSLLGGISFVGPLFLFDIVDVSIDLSVTQVALAIPLLGAVARLMLLAGRWRRSYVAALLGPDRESVLEDRVEELSVQRDQVLDAVADERRRIERNLHDGVQQQLVALGIDIGRARNKLDDDPDAARELLDDARDKVRASIGELRLIGRGLHPAVLGDRGLDAALSSVVANSPIPISVDIVPIAGEPGGVPSEVAETAYYIANEAVANVLKYAGARVASIRVEPDPGLLPAVRVTVHDDGRGGADPSRGSGIAGMRARVEAVDGGFRIDSPVGGPTVLTAVIPLKRERYDESDLDDPARASARRVDHHEGADHG